MFYKMIVKSTMYDMKRRRRTPLTRTQRVVYRKSRGSECDTRQNEHTIGAVSPAKGINALRMIGEIKSCQVWTGLQDGSDGSFQKRVSCHMHGERATGQHTVS